MATPKLPGSKLEALTRSGEMFTLLVASVRDYAIFMLDPAGRIASWNPGAERVKGYTTKEIIGLHFSVFYPEEDVRGGKCERALELAARVGRYEDEGWRVRKDGSRFWANVVITAMRDATGTLVGFAKITRDLTERKAVEDERDRFRQFVASVQDYALFVLDRAGNIATWNPGAERITGYTAGEIIGRHFSVFYPEEDVRAGKCEMELEVAARVGRFEDEGWRLRKDGTRLWANVVITAMRDATGTLVGFSQVLRDLTDRQHAEDERAARLAAEHANRLKDEFLAILGHELRNPLAPIVTALQILKLRAQTRPSKELQVIDRQVRQLMHLVDDLLDISRISRDKIELKRRTLDVRQPLRRALETVSPLIEQKGHELEVLVPPHAFMVHADEARLTQVFTNLVMNAAKYTDSGGHIAVSVRRAGDDIEIAVRDDGTGIAPELLPRIFELFVQGTQGVDRAIGGLGLGLTLVRKLVELHGGRVVAHSDGIAQGSTFTVYLPALPREPVATNEHADPQDVALPAACWRILVVDDNEDARTLLAEILRTYGHEVAVADSAASALAIARESPPDVAILDIGLPDTDGYTLAGELRALPGLAHTQLLALSGYGTPADRERSRAAGFVQHIVKPVDIRQLVKLLAALGDG